MDPAIRLLKGIYCWFICVASTVTFFSLLCAARLILPLLGRPDDDRTAHKFASLWGRTIFTLIPGWKISITGKENLPADGKGYVIVANHESMSDILAMYYLGIQFRWLSKDAVFKYPLIGQAMRWAKYVPIVRGDRSSGHEAMQASREHLKRGIPMFFFPEGTRSIDGRIKEFKPGAFKLAQDEDVAILPVAIHGAMKLLPKHSLVPGKAHVHIKILPLIETPKKESLPDLTPFAETVRERIIEAHTGLTKL